MRALWWRLGQVARCVAQPVPRIGLPGWQWLTEVNSDVINCLHGRCGTSFVGPAGSVDKKAFAGAVARGKGEPTRG